MSAAEAFVLGGNRIPFARSHGAYADVPNQEMLTAAIDGLVARCGLAGERVGEVAAGAVLKHARDFNLTREAVLGSALDPATPAFDVQMACATGVETVWNLTNKIRLGQLDSGIAGGVDTASDAPIAVSEKLRRALLALGRAKTVKQRLAAVAALRPADIKPEAPGTGEPRTGLSMGEHQAITTAGWGITREAQDELAMNSHRNLAAAYDRGFFDDLLTGFHGLARDNNLRPDSSMEALAKLKPVFGRSLPEEATMTAGNSTPLTDGASAVLLGSEEAAELIGRDPVARIAGRGAHALVPQDFGIAPVAAAEQALARAGIGWGEVGAIELNEAFAAQSLACLDAWEVDPQIVNARGGAIAIGHPLGASGGRILGTLAARLRETGSRWGVAAICIGVGQGLAVVLENVAGDEEPRSEENDGKERA